MEKGLQQKIFSVSNDSFEEISLKVFRYQSLFNPIYKQYVELLGVNPDQVTSIDHIPFLPISFFKTHKVIVDGSKSEIVFSSSGTTGNQTSKHFVVSTELYRESFTKGFEWFYGLPSKYCVLALLPSYLEREGSSLVYMVRNLVELSGHSQGGFYLNNQEELAEKLIALSEKNQPIILIGVTFALLELAKRFKKSIPNTIIMETGGMKGRGKELVRSELHSILCESFGVKSIHSEYGMTELLSQAYSKGDGIFQSPPWMRVRIRDPYDPFSYIPAGRSGAINVIDLANLYSCSFLQTDDLGVLHPNGSFEVLGRMEGSQIRGCNLLITP